MIFVIFINSEYENQHNMFLEEKAAEERKKHQQSIENGKAELDKFYAERKQKVSKTQEENRYSLM